MGEGSKVQGVGLKVQGEGFQLDPFRVGSLAVLLFDVSIGTPKSCEAVCFFFLPEARLGCGLGELRGGGDHGPLGKTRKGWCRDGLRCPLRSELVGGVGEWAGGVQVRRKTMKGLNLALLNTPNMGVEMG